MPELPQYSAPMAQRGLQPSDLGVSANEMAGRRIGTAYREMGQAIGGAIDTYEQHQAQQETSALTADYAKTFAAATESWNQTATKADPNNPNTAQQWRDGVLEPMLEKLGANAQSKQGQAEANRLRSELRMHFTEKTIADQSNMAGAAVEQNLNTTVKVLGNAVHDDPSAMDGALKILSGSIDAQIAGHGAVMSPDTAARIRTELKGNMANSIAESALFGLAEQNAPAAQAALDSGKFDPYFTPQQMKAARAYVEQQSKLNTTLAAKQGKDAADADMATINASTIDANGQLTLPKDYFSNVVQWMAKYKNVPGAADTVAEKGRTAIDYGRQIQKELAEGTPTQTDPHTYEDMTNRLTLPETDPNHLTPEQVIRARADAKLSDKDYHFLEGALNTLNRDPAYKYANARFNDFMKTIKSSITKSNILMGNNDPAGDQRWGQYMQQARDQFETAYKQGGSAWHDLLDRSNQKSLWYQAVPYMTDQKGGLQDLQNRISGTPGLVPQVRPQAVPRKPGESAADYLKRTGGP